MGGDVEIRSLTWFRDVIRDYVGVWPMRNGGGMQSLIGLNSIGWLSRYHAQGPSLLDTVEKSIWYHVAMHVLGNASLRLDPTETKLHKAVCHSAYPIYCVSWRREVMDHGTGNESVGLCTVQWSSSLQIRKSRVTFLSSSYINWMVDLTLRVFGLCRRWEG